MRQYTQKALRKLVADGLAIDLTHQHDRKALPERCEQVGFAKGIYGLSGKLLRGESGQLYAITTSTSALYLF